ncbi:MAG: gliding motility-associated ABC transporter ATP-binding subunit GldA [Chitinophagales bacterium]
MSIQVSQLSKVYGAQHAVDQISFEAAKGEVLGFLGPNGAGKSTTMKMVTCFIPPTTGTIHVCGINTAEKPLEVRKKIGYLPESNPLYYDMYVYEYLEFMAGLHKIANPKERIEEMIEVTGLKAERKKIVGQLSKGYKQRVGLAQAILHDPEVLILDEPTSGLDPNQLIEIRALIKQLGRNKTVVFSSHIMQEVQAVADRVIIINKGKIVANDTTEHLQLKLNNEITVTAVFKQKVERALIGQIKGIKSFSQSAEGKWTLIGGNGGDLREDVFHFAKNHDLTLLELHRESYSLEDVFKEVTSSK